MKTSKFLTDSLQAEETKRRLCKSRNALAWSFSFRLKLNEFFIIILYLDENNLCLMACSEISLEKVQIDLGLIILYTKSDPKLGLI